jgi:hypothetical protein
MAVLPDTVPGGGILGRFAERRPRIANAIRSNPSALLNFGLGMLSGSNRSEAWANAQQGMAYGAQTDQARRDRTQQEEEQARQEEARNNLFMTPEFQSLSNEDRAWLMANPGAADQFIASNIQNRMTPATTAPPELEDFWNPETGQIERRAWVNGQWTTQGLGAPDSPLVVNNLGSDGIDYGDPPANHAWARDANRDVMLDERGVPVALPIGPALIEQQEREAAEAAAGEAADAAARQQQVTTDFITSKLNEVLGQVNGWTAGLGQQLLGGIGGTAQRDLAANIATLRSNIALESLQAAREASPTGSTGMGPLTDRDIEILMNKWSNIDPTQSPDQLSRNVIEFRNTYLDMVHGPGAWRIGENGQVFVGGAGGVNLRQGAAVTPPPAGAAPSAATPPPGVPAGAPVATDGRGGWLYWNGTAWVAPGG